MSPDLLSAVITSGLGLIGVVVAAWLGKRAGAAKGHAAVKEAETNAREAATADWKAFTDGLLERLTKVEGRLAEAEARTAKAEDRASRAEGLYRVAIGYLRQIVRWCGERHGEPLPDVPPELAGDL